MKWSLKFISRTLNVPKMSTKKKMTKLRALFKSTFRLGKLNLNKEFR